jgi:hypothetical protein
LTSARAGGFELAIGSFNFYMEDAGVSELLSMADSMPVADSMAPSPAVTQHAVEDISTPASPLPPSGTGQAPESSTPLVKSKTL